MTEGATFSARCHLHAARHPDRTAIIEVAPDGSEQSITWGILDRCVDAVAAVLQEAGTGPATTVVVALPDGIEHCVTTLAAWRLGSCVLPLSQKMPAVERDRMLELVAGWRRPIFVGDAEVPLNIRVRSACVTDRVSVPASRFGDPVPQPGRAIGSGGSTGRPKIIVDPKPWMHIPGRWGALTRVGLRAGQTQLVLGRQYHTIGFLLSHVGLFEGHKLILTRQFDPDQAVSLIERYGVQFMGIVPIHMQRIAKLADVSAERLSSLEAIYHAGAACPPWVKRRWLQLMPPERVWELYGSTEENGIVMIRGDDWLRHPTSVGRPFECDVRIVDDAGETVPDGVVGSIYMRPVADPDVPLGGTWPQRPVGEYVGASSQPELPDGLRSVGDMGSITPDGYLQIADRRVDMIVSGGANVYPAEVEAALSEHPGIADVVVIGVPDEEWGHRVHALVQPARWPCELDAAELDRFCRERLLGEKLPRSYEWIETLPRDQAGKIRRTALREDRLTARSSSRSHPTDSRSAEPRKHGRGI